MFTDHFIRRPVLSLSLSFLILIVGLQSLFNIQVREYPELTSTTVTVTTAYYGAPAKVIQGFITQPLQQAVAEADHIDYLDATSRMGVSTISAVMNPGTNPDAALAEIMSKVNSVKSQLPSEAREPVITRSTGDSTAIMYISFTSDNLTAAEVGDYLRRNVQNQLVTVTGVAKADVYSPPLGMRIWLNPTALSKYGLSANEVLSKLQQNNFSAAPGQVKGRSEFYDIDINTDLTSVESFEQMVVGNTPQGVVRLSDIADVEMAAIRETVVASFNGRNNSMIAIEPTSTANPLEVAKGVNQKLPAIAASLPGDLQMVKAFDTSEYIQSSIDEVLVTILEAGAIVIFVIFLFMGSVRPMIIPVVAIPFSLIGVCLSMEMMGFSINLLTLLAMVLAIGLVVDDSIVVVENVERHLRMGKTPFKAAIDGTREIALPVISMTVVLVAVFVPIAMMTGVTGSLFKEFALTLAGAVVVSGVVALTLSPMMCAYMLRPAHKERGIERVVHIVLDKITELYSRALTGLLAHKGAVLWFLVLVFASMVILVKFIPAELAPAEDKNGFLVIGNAPSNVNTDYLKSYSTEVSDRLLDIDGVKSTLLLNGIPASNQSLGIIKADDWTERALSQSELIANVLGKTSDIAGMSYAAFPFPSLPGAGGGVPLQVVLKGNIDYPDLYKLAEQFQGEMKATGKIVYSQIDVKYDASKVVIDINHDKAARYDVSMRDIALMLGTYLGDGNINYINIDGRSYEVVPQIMRKDRLTPELLGQYFVSNRYGEQVPLSNLVDISVTSNTLALKQMDQANAITLSFVARPDIPMGEAIGVVREQAELLLPNQVSYDFKGESRQYLKEGDSMYYIFALALIVVFLVLAIQFESFRDPLVILFTVPLAISGALAAMVQFEVSMNIYTQIGMLTLVGLITKHGILMCEVAKEQQMMMGGGRVAAISYAAKIRLRPILMTTLAMIAGVLPLVFAEGPGAISRSNIGIVIAAGLAIGTLFTLFVLPVLYSIFGSKHTALPSLD